ncbi:hypothetical protein Cni_G22998 [Canna indica]|uniref:MULE transposase domain-containing protein n=1 Tax=Canna indica TaxID=4628 RepID=A0AAQ3QLT6_9LILI|nr:hypothetical protein Cni_G22998 [Canna indica]
MHCLWRIYGSWKPGEITFIIKSYVNEHKCSRSMTNRQATVEWLANYYMEQFKQNPSWDVKLMAIDFQFKFYISIARAKWYRVRSYALEKLRGSVEDRYALLGPYLAEPRKKNPASLFNIVCDKEFTGAPPIFKRLYIVFDALKKRFLHDCRPIVGFDGCFLKTFLGGQLLSAIGINGNNQMFPISWAVVEGENYDAWRWVKQASPVEAEEEEGGAEEEEEGEEMPGSGLSICSPRGEWSGSIIRERDRRVRALQEDLNVTQTSQNSPNVGHNVTPRDD